MIINEQSYQDLIKDGWVTTPPKNYNPKDYKVKMSSNIRLYKRKDGKSIDQSEVGIQTFEGIYTTNIPAIKKIKVYKGKDENGEESLYLSSIYLDKIPQLKNYVVSKLTPSENNPLIFSISNKSGEVIPNAITFKPNGFVFAYTILNKVFTLTATKEETKDSDKVDIVTPDKTNKDTNVNPDNKKTNIPIVKSKPLYFNKDKKDALPTKTCSDFPFTLGCVNTKIGDLNAKFFSGDRNNDAYNKELENFLDNMGYFPNSSKEITQDLWVKLMNKSVIKESIKKVLKEYINKKK